MRVSARGFPPVAGRLTLFRQLHTARCDCWMLCAPKPTRPAHSGHTANDGGRVKPRATVNKISRRRRRPERAVPVPKG